MYKMATLQQFLTNSNKNIGKKLKNRFFSKYCTNVKFYYINSKIDVKVKNIKNISQCYLLENGKCYLLENVKCNTKLILLVY